MAVRGVRLLALLGTSENIHRLWVSFPQITHAYLYIARPCWNGRVIYVIIGFNTNRIDTTPTLRDNCSQKLYF